VDKEISQELILSHLDMYTIVKHDSVCPVCQAVRSVVSGYFKLKEEVATLRNLIEKVRGNVDPFNADNVTLNNFDGIVTCRKKPIIIHALQINFLEGFRVSSKEGVLTGKPGDYLMFGVDGEKYICDKEIFERTYEVVGKRKTISDSTEPLHKDEKDK